MDTRKLVAFCHTYNRYGVATNVAVSIVRDFLAAALEALEEGERLTLPWGTVKLVESPVLEMRNPSTGETIAYESRRRVKFRAALSLRKRLAVKKLDSKRKRPVKRK
jgi:nucleoid DNA-binding protein